MPSYLRGFSIVQQAAISHLILRLLVLVLIEDECARLIEQATGQPAVLGNWLLAGLYALALAGSVLKRRHGFVLGMAAGGINVIAKVIILGIGHEFFPNRPLVYIIQSLVVIYFSYLAFMECRDVSR